MKRWLLMLCCATTLLAAPPAQKVMVLQGAGPILSGQLWAEGKSISLPAGSSVALLVLGEGRRLKVTGPAEIVVGPGGVSVTGGKSQELKTVSARLVLTGENHRQISGGRFRMVVGTPPEPLPSARFDRIQVSATQLTVSAPKGPEGAARFCFYEVFSPQRDHPTSIEEIGVKLDEPLTVEARYVGGRVTYSLPLPAKVSPGTTFAVQVTSAQDEKLWLYTRLHVMTSEETAELVRARFQTLAWAKSEPGNPQPWLVYANLLEERSQLCEARDAVLRALQMRPTDPGLWTMLARLHMDLSDFDAAKASQGKTNARYP